MPAAADDKASTGNAKGLLCDYASSQANFRDVMDARGNQRRWFGQIAIRAWPVAVVVMVRLMSLKQRSSQKEGRRAWEKVGRE